MTNPSHRRELARRLVEETGINYNAALDRVRQAAARGVFHGPLDPAGIEAAVRLIIEAQRSAPDLSKVVGRKIGPPSSFLARCAPAPHAATPAVAWRLIESPTVETWYYPNREVYPGDALEYVVRRPLGLDEETGRMRCIDHDNVIATEPVISTERDRIHPDGLGITFISEMRGWPTHTLRAGAEGLPLGSMTALLRAREQRRGELGRQVRLMTYGRESYFDDDPK